MAMVSVVYWQPRHESFGSVTVSVIFYFSATVTVNLNNTVQYPGA